MKKCLLSLFTVATLLCGGCATTRCKVVRIQHPVGYLDVQVQTPVYYLK